MRDAGTTIWREPGVTRHIQCLVRSYRHWTGRDLVPSVSDPLQLARRVHEASVVVMSHGMESDPILNYGNQAALDLWEMSWEDLTRTPSRLTAEAPLREERERLLRSVANNGYMDDYAGIRVSRTGRRFRILQATVWNLISEAGQPCGQAAAFKDWEIIESKS